MAVSTIDSAPVEGAGLTRDERAARGKAARTAVPRSSHADFERPAGCPAPLDLLAQQDSARVPELVPLRYGRMAVSAFTYFRGAALPMTADLANTPRTGFTGQICGDAHLLNFGLFSSPERRLVFDINDFDETLPGPWEWDVKRLGASVEIAGRDNGFTPRQRRDTVLAAIGEYRRAMRVFARSTALEVWYTHADAESVRAVYTQTLDAARRRKLDRTLAKARARDNLGALNRFTEMVDGRPRIASDPPRIVRIAELAEIGQPPDEVLGRLQVILRAYRDMLEPERRALLDRYSVADIARKVVGVGSVGTRCWMVLLLGNDDRDPLFLQAKEANSSVLEGFAGPSRYGNAGRRVVVGQRLMQTVSDVFLGWVRVQGFDGRPRDFYLRQLRDGKGSAAVETMDVTAMLAYGRLCGWTLARAHARTADPIALAAYLGAGAVFEEAIADFAVAYADQNERDYGDLLAAIAAGRVVAGADR
ncbi:DUF2252 domain-containing protein [Amycolatopsis sp. K13G38]|uniref:DUF2252 domain-containing protein n=1 Tax=Amycolatopsis acididurans TaxID=2724524 RepID=A0ABX1IYD1_9PSEU|nr:DUF2252 domain-containing protein [Amycolatopsis acididurans]NKQ52334.1 DUF2252 domain-containing protein [Amycolatopsis acididurans]